MMDRIYKASKTNSKRRGWSVTFRHPRRTDARGKYGLKVRRGLGTRNDAEADKLVEQLNNLLMDEHWWSIDRRTEAERQFDSIVVSAFFDGIEAGSIQTRELRERIMPLPSAEDGYAKVMMVGSTGAGKTTLLRHLIGSDHIRDRFPSTSTAKTTTADIEIVTAHDRFEAVVTFMTEHEARCVVDECLEEACISVIRGSDDAGIARALLEHREQRFRLSYVLGTWQQERPKTNADARDAKYDFGNTRSDVSALRSSEVVPNSEIDVNNEMLYQYIAQIKGVAKAVQKQKTSVRGSFLDMTNANDRQEWLEDFTDGLYEDPDFSTLSLDIMESIQERFNLVTSGDFQRSSTGWPALWHCKEDERQAFLQQVRWFTGNHGQQFGRLLTPLVDGIRVRGDFQPAVDELQNPTRQLVLLDGEGLGHTAREAASVSTRVTERFQDVDMILLVDNAQSPMQAAPLELLRSVGSSGHAHKVSVVFTHFDQVQGDNLHDHFQKVEHVRASIRNAVLSLRESLGAPVTEILERQLLLNDFYLGGLNLDTGGIPLGFIEDIGTLMERMQQSAESGELTNAAPIYNVARLELALRDATDGFKNPWKGRLGLLYYDGVRKEHWGRVKALCRRIAVFRRNEYDGLRPVADLIRQLQTSISLWLDNPSGWVRIPANEEEGQEIINAIRQDVYMHIHRLANRRLIETHRRSWMTAFGFSGPGSSFVRAREIGNIYDAAAPSISSVMDTYMQKLLDEVIQIVNEAVEEAGGSIEGIPEYESSVVA